MISVIHPTSHFGPSAGAVGGSRVPAFPGFTTGQTALMQTASSSHDQISDLYRRRSSGYTHHVSNSSWMTTSASIAASAATAAGPTPASSTSGAVPRGPPVAHSQQQQPPRAVSSRSLSSYSSVSTHTTGRQQPTLSTVVASNIHPSRQQPTSSSTIASSIEVGQIKPRGLVAPPPGKDFSKPLFVDCSIEYELPNAPKIPKNSLPILMIHPGYQEKKRQQIQREQQIQQQQQQQQRQQQQQQLLMNIKNKDNIAVNNSKQTGCTAPNCHCRKIVSSMKPGTKRSYSNALGSNASTTTTQAQFYKQQQQQQQQQLLQQQQKNRPAPPAHHAYFEAQAAAAAHANASSMSAASEAKRSRMMASVEQQKQQQQQHQLLQYNHQQLFRAQMQAAAALRHYQQSFGYTTRGGAGSATMNPQVSQPQIHPSVTSARAASTSSNQAPTTLSRPDMMRISSFQQITPPESLAFWQQQQQLTSSVTCRSACCANAGPAAYTNCTPVRPAVCCYPTPMVTGNPTGTTAGFCIGCAQGKCQVNVNKENLGIMRSL
jgi:hypothetical protein